MFEWFTCFVIGTCIYVVVEWDWLIVMGTWKLRCLFLCLDWKHDMWKKKRKQYEMNDDYGSRMGLRNPCIKYAFCRKWRRSDLPNNSVEKCTFWWLWGAFGWTKTLVEVLGALCIEPKELRLDKGWARRIRSFCIELEDSQLDQEWTQEKWGSLDQDRSTDRSIGLNQ